MAVFRKGELPINIPSRTSPPSIDWVDGSYDVHEAAQSGGGIFFAADQKGPPSTLYTYDCSEDGLRCQDSFSFITP